jgi:acyl-CoA reductase-like NAD-dependent aldehyde dehydrogenase
MSTATTTSETVRYGNHIGGKQIASTSGETFTSINPITGKPWGTFSQSGADDVDQAVSAAQAALNGEWGRLSPSAKGRLLIAWGEAIAGNAQLIAMHETEQNGKLLTEMQAQAKIVKDWLFYFGGLADKVEGRVIPLERSSVLNYTLREPLGVIGVIVPWNSPTLISIMSMAPALAAGNTIVLKPSEITSASAFDLAELAESAGIPPGVINVVTGARESGDALVSHPGVAKIVFTGSEQAGRAIAAKAGGRLAACTLELGGKSANIVFDDARLDQAEAGVLAGIFAAAGQTCIAGSRAYVHRKIYDQFVDRLVTRAKQIKLGDPRLPATQMGPVATRAQLDKDLTMVAQALDDGAEVLCGGKRASVAGFDDGLFFEPTIFHRTKSGDRIMNEEVFGPVLCVTPFDDDEEVLALANGTRFGLAAGMWTCSLQRAHTFAKRLEAGTVWINMYRALAFNSPFGGYKASGLGRVNGAEAIEQYLQTKSVWCELGSEVQDPFVLRL